MSVYIELVILDNFVLTYMLGALTHFVMKSKQPKIRLIIGSAIGTIVAVFYPFISKTFWLVSTKIALFLALSAIFFAKNGRIFISGLVFLGLTLLFGGAVFGVSLMCYGSIPLAVQMQTPVPVSAIILSAILVYFSVKKVANTVRKIRDASDNIYRYSLKILGKTLTGKGFLDTGNRLYDERSGLPIIVLTAKKFISILTDEQAYLLVSGQGEKIQKGARYISIETVGGGNRKILLLNADEFILYLPDQENIMCMVRVGVSFSPLCDCVKYDLLLHPSLKN